MFFSKFSKFFECFEKFSKVLEVFGPIRTHSDPFGCIRMHWDAFGNKWLVSEKIGILGIFCDFFGRCRMALRVLWGVLNITLSFQTFSDTLDNFS